MHDKQGFPAFSILSSLLHFICTCTYDRAEINSASLFGRHFLNSRYWTFTTHCQQLYNVLDFTTQTWGIEPEQLDRLCASLGQQSIRIFITQPQHQHITQNKMARQLLTTILLAITFTTTLASTLPQQTSLPLNRTLNPLDTRSNYGWSPAVLLQDSTGICPQHAYINCQSISGPNYCCGAGTYCAYGGPENHIGCCADNAVCDGEPVVPYTTVWVPSATATTWWTRE